MSGCNFCTPAKTCYWCAKKGKPKKELKRTPLKKSTEPIKKVADKRAKELRRYSKERKQFLTENPTCQCGRIENGKVCQRPATEIQHSFGRENKLLLNKKYWKATSAECRVWEISHPVQAQETGIALRRNVSIEKRNN